VRTQSFAARVAPTALVALGLVLALSLLSLAFGEAPRATLSRAWVSTWGTAYGIGQVLFKATPLLYTGLAFHVAHRAGLFNIGAEGQLGLAAFVCGVVAAKLPAGLPALLAVPIALAFAAGTGAAVAAVPGALRARFGVSEIISCILVNRMVDIALPWLLADVVDSRLVRTPDAIPGARIPRLAVLVSPLEGSAASFAFPLAIAVVVLVLLRLPKTAAGREMRFVGLSDEPCRREGLDVARLRLVAMVLSGGFAALAASATVLGYKGYYELGLGSNAGFTGIAVALLSRGSALGLVLSALFFGTLEQAGLGINAFVPKDAMDLLVALAVVLYACTAELDRRDRAEARA